MKKPNDKTNELSHLPRGQMGACESGLHKRRKKKERCHRLYRADNKMSRVCAHVNRHAKLHPGVSHTRSSKKFNPSCKGLVFMSDNFCLPLEVSVVIWEFLTHQERLRTRLVCQHFSTLGGYMIESLMPFMIGREQTTRFTIHLSQSFPRIRGF